MCEFDKKVFKFFKTNIKSIFIPIITSFIAGLILYNIQIMVETTKQQIEYFGKIKEDTESLFLKKYQLNNEKVETLFLLLKKNREIFYETINNNKDEEKILIEYLDNLERIPTKKFSQELIDKEALQLTKEIEIGFLNERIHNNILLLKIYSNNSLNNYDKEIEEQLNSLDKMYIYLIKYMNESIYKLTNRTYIIQNLRTSEDFKRLLLTFNSNELEKNIREIQESSNKTSLKVEQMEIKMLNEINNRINGNIFEKLPYLFKSKVEIFK